MNLASLLVETAKKHPDKTAVRFDRNRISYGDLDKRCNRLANGLLDLGLGSGDRIVVMTPNSADYIAVYYAVAKIGATLIPVNFLYKAHELQHILADSKPKAFIGAAPYLDEITKTFKAIEAPPILIAWNAPEGGGFMDFEKVLSDKTDFALYPSDDEDIVHILYTSGTTGRARGVMLSHGNIRRNATIIADMRGVVDPRTTVIGVLPLYHIYGITSVLNASVYQGLTIELMPHFDPLEVIKVMEREEVSVIFAVPTMYNRLIQSAAERQPKSRNLKYCVSGGASLPVEFLQRFEKAFHTKIYEGYGLTEAPVCIENPYGKKTKQGSIGLPIPEYEAKIVDPMGVEVPQGAAGELLVKGAGVMKGYLNLPRETREVLQDGWLFTGDMARQDEEGYFYIVDRKKELVIRGGYNVYPREVEELLYQIPDVVEAAVFGVAHEDLGEEVAAVVYLREGSQMTPNDIRAYVKERIAPYKYPRIVSLIDQPLPKSGSGKILKRQVKKLFASAE